MAEMIANYLRRNMYVFYGSQILNGLRFIAPVWVLFFTHYITFSQLAFLEALGLFISVVLELPTGVLADLIGRKNSIIFGYVVSGIGYMVIGFGHSFEAFLIGYTINSFGASFASGADTAILFDTLKEHDLVDDYGKYSGRTVFMYRLSVIVSMVIGQYLYAVFIGLPYVACGLGIVASGLVYVFAREPSREREHITPELYFKRIGLGFQEAFKNTATRYLSLYFITIASVELMLLWFYYAPYLSWLGYTDHNIGIIYAAIAAGRMFVTLASQKLDKLLGDKNVLYLLPLILGLSLLMGFVRNIYIGTAFLFIHYALFTLRYTVLNKYTNVRFNSKYRASAISSLNMFVSLVYATVVLGLGKVITLDNVGIILTIFGGVLLFVTLPLGVMFVNSRATGSKTARAVVA